MVLSFRKVAMIGKQGMKPCTRRRDGSHPSRQGAMAPLGIPFSSVPTTDVTESLDRRQGTGYPRAIGDGAKFGHASVRGTAKMLDLCTTVQLALQARGLVKALDNLGAPQPEQKELRLESGSDDRPSAYRWVPTRPDERFPNIVAVWMT